MRKQVFFWLGKRRTQIEVVPELDIVVVKEQMSNSLFLPYG